MHTHAGIRDPFEARGDVHPISEKVVAFDQHVAEVDADAVDDASVFGDGLVALGHHRLNGDRAIHCGDDGWEFDEHGVAHGLESPAALRRRDGLRRLSPLAHGLSRPRLVLAHHARVADDVGGEDRGELAGGGHVMVGAS
jgi:hypothetical protein